MSAKILRSIEQGRFAGLRRIRARRRPSASSAGIFTIANGIADNQDLRLVSPHRARHRCRHLQSAPRSLDYTVRPKVASSTPTPTVPSINLSNVEIPVRIEGPWDKPNFSVGRQEQSLKR